MIYLSYNLEAPLSSSRSMAELADWVAWSDRISLLSNIFIILSL